MDNSPMAIVRLGMMAIMQLSDSIKGLAESYFFFASDHVGTNMVSCLSQSSMENHQYHGLTEGWSLYQFHSRPSKTL